ncbi:nucleoside diphosphate kinase regulator [Hafnia psychrotolerans]|uniref:Regulator of nucleoside diphosphate kinase n=1 Tax=Hafnia psychrotolerans TaxID=1477018 RepID=A0ABQ1H5W3_9GAMM|nr:nucleoside diphosphate kinase regulator [Hafnia psychrotolerans]GGA58652.1 regulator of nucleoside diphosphate kinase [Hafnia psychrotolerans]
MSKPTLTINELDAERLDTLLAKPMYANNPVAEALNEELDRAEILPPQDMPADVVTMNSKVRFTEGKEGEEHIRTLVYPAALKDTDQQLSVMAPLGAALLGLRVGSIITWTMPNGKESRIEVLELLFQPEASGELRG